MKRFLCRILRHPRKYDTGNRIDNLPVIRCPICERAWFGKDEILPNSEYDRYNNPWDSRYWS